MRLKMLRQSPRVILVIVSVVLPLVGCVPYQPQMRPPAGTPIVTQNDTIELEAADRIARFRRLASSFSVLPPEVEQLSAPLGSIPGVEKSVPVVRLVFDERLLFDFDRDTPQPGASEIIQMIAENMKRDVPDAALTILGHTDAIGSDEYNIDLSRRRAASVMADLIAYGVTPGQLSAIAIGKAQPIAPNDTPEGRSRNRRVEFMISGSERANLAVVGDRPVNPTYFRTAMNRPVLSPPSSVEILKPTRRPSTPDDKSFHDPMGLLPLKPPTEPPALASPKPEPAAHPLTPASTPPPLRTPKVPSPLLQEPVPPEVPEQRIPAPLPQLRQVQPLIPES
jgi:outer membrane protein OmpA-like peptidoglycan-associated protein